MKFKILTGLARCLLIIPFVSVLSFSILKMNWMHKVYEKIESLVHKEELISRCYTADQLKKLNWINKKEFVVNDIWYDIVYQIKYEDGASFLTLFPDIEEDKWLKSLFNSKKDQPLSQNKPGNQNDFKSCIFQDLGISLNQLPKCRELFKMIVMPCGMNYSFHHFPPPRIS